MEGRFSALLLGRSILAAPTNDWGEEIRRVVGCRRQVSVGSSTACTWARGRRGYIKSQSLPQASLNHRTSCFHLPNMDSPAKKSDITSTPKATLDQDRTTVKVGRFSRRLSTYSRLSCTKNFLTYAKRKHTDQSHGKREFIETGENETGEHTSERLEDEYEQRHAKRARTSEAFDKTIMITAPDTVNNIFERLKELENNLVEKDTQMAEKDTQIVKLQKRVSQLEKRFSSPDSESGASTANNQQPPLEA